MPEQEYDPLLGSAGLVDDIDATITEVTFAYDAQYAGGNQMPAQVFLAYDGSDEPERLLLSTGTGWEPAEKGRKAVREDTGEPNPKGFNRQCAFQQFLAAAMESGAEDIIRERVGQGVKPWDAGLLEGLVFHFERKTYKKLDGSEGDRLMPTVFLGVKGEEKAPAKKAEPKAEAKGDDEDTGSAIPGALKAKLKKLAKECDSHDEFIERAYEVDGVDGNEAVEEAITDPDGLYAEARA